MRRRFLWKKDKSQLVSLVMATPAWGRELGFSPWARSVSYAYMLAELWGFKKWSTAWRRLFGRVLSWWIWFCQTSLRNVLFIFLFFLFFWKVREHKTNCHVLQDPRKMSGHQKVTCGRRVSDLSRTRELESKDTFPFEALGWDRRRKSQEPWLESVQISADESISVA